MPVTVRSLGARLLASAGLAIVAIALPVASAGSAPKQGKLYEVVVSPAFAGATVSDPGAPPLNTAGDYTVTIENKTGTQQLGSANLRIPPEITVVGDRSADRGDVLPAGSDPRLVELRNLNLANNEKVTVKLGLRMPCTAASAWQVEAKQSNDFSGPPGNALGPLTGASVLNTRLDGSCSLRFADQPGDAQTGEQIRVDDFAPASTNYVSVETLDGAGQLLTWFSGSIQVEVGTGPAPLIDPASSQPSNGVAEFSNLSIGTSGGYTLRAETADAGSGFAAGDSADFLIVDEEQPCNAASCNATLDDTPPGQPPLVSSLSVQGAAGTNVGHVLLSRNVGNALTPQTCDGYDSPLGGDHYDFMLTVERATTTTLTYTKSAMRKVKGGPAALEVCFAAPLAEPFPTKTGFSHFFDYDGRPGQVGLLPNCGLTPSQACVLSRTGTPSGGAIVTFYTQEGWSDPRCW